MRGQIYFYRLQVQLFCVRWRCSTISINGYLRGLLYVLFDYALCGASSLQAVELQISLGDDAVRDSTLESVILFVQKVCDHSLNCIIT